MEETLISLKTANKYLKVGGVQFLCEYDSLANSYYCPLLNDHIIEYDESINVSNQSLLQKWLREVHNLHVIIQPEFYTTGINYCVQVLCYAPELEDCEDNNKCTGMYGDNGEYPTYEEALEFGLQLALNLIK
jgi:hypothetical protein